jgi:acetyl esterase/lipase
VARVQAAGGVVRLRCHADLPHVFHAFAPLIPEAGRAIEDLAASLRS